VTWDQLVDVVLAHHPDITHGKMFGMPCLKGADGKVIATLGKDGAITVKLVDETARTEVLALPGTDPGSHAFNPSRPMREWVHIPATQSGEWQRLVERALV